jgi:hypothetical protein
MSQLNFRVSNQTNQPPLILKAGWPTPSSNQKPSITEKRNTDPSSSLQKEHGYPIPSFFRYPSNPKELDSL